MGISADAPAAPADPLLERVAALVTRTARDDDDRQLLMEALGLTPTVDRLAEAG